MSLPDRLATGKLRFISKLGSLRLAPSVVQPASTLTHYLAGFLKGSDSTAASEYGFADDFCDRCARSSRGSAVRSRRQLFGAHHEWTHATGGAASARNRGQFQIVSSRAMRLEIERRWKFHFAFPLLPSAGSAGRKTQVHAGHVGVRDRYFQGSRREYRLHTHKKKRPQVGDFHKRHNCR